MMEHGQAEGLALSVRPEIRLKPERIDGRHESLDRVERGTRHRSILRHMTSVKFQHFQFILNSTDNNILQCPRASLKQFQLIRRSTYISYILQYLTRDINISFRKKKNQKANLGGNLECVKKSMDGCHSVSAACRPADKRQRYDKFSWIRRWIVMGTSSSPLTWQGKIERLIRICRAQPSTPVTCLKSLYSRRHGRRHGRRNLWKQNKSGQSIVPPAS